MIVGIAKMKLYKEYGQQKEYNMPKIIKKSKEGEYILAHNDYWMLVKEEGEYLWYLSKSRMMCKKKIQNNIALRTIEVELTRYERRKFNVKKLWDEKFGAYERKYGKHNGDIIKRKRKKSKLVVKKPKDDYNNSVGQYSQKHKSPDY
jgi:hypothetical protein